MKFKYAKYGKNVLRPVIPIKLKSGDQEMGYEVLVDSGADMCLFDAALGEQLGIEIKKGKPFEVMGVGGKASVFYWHPIILEVGGWEYVIKAGFMPNVSGKVLPYGVVGQKGFFEHFIVKFDLTKEQIELKKK